MMVGIPGSPMVPFVLKPHFIQRIYIYIYLYIFIYIFISTHTRKHTHAYTHTHKRSLIGFLCSSKNSGQPKSKAKKKAFRLLTMSTLESLSKADTCVYLTGGTGPCLGQEQSPIGADADLEDLLPCPCGCVGSVRQSR